MMYSEFMENTGCKDNENNYSVFKNLEVMYMNSEIEKSIIYDYGKKLVDNSKSQSEIDTENKLKKEIEDIKSLISENNLIISVEKLASDIEDNTKSIKSLEEQNKEYRKRIKTIKKIFNI